MPAEMTQPINLPLLVTKETCAGSTYIVTGANVGLGYEAAKHLVALGSSKVILACRDTETGEKAKAEIEAATGTSNIAEVWKLDLADYKSVKEFAKKALALDRIDALIENAGVAIRPHATAEGHKLQLTVNVFSTFLLAVLLLPKMSEDAKKFGILPHITVITSGSCFDMEAAWNSIKDDPVGKMDGESLTLQLYPLSKLLEVFAVEHLGTLLPVSRTGVVINTVCPGVCRTTLSRDAPPAFKAYLAQLWESMGRTAEDGSRTLLHGAVAGKESHGRVLQHCELSKTVPSWITDEEGVKSQKIVWEVITNELETIEPGCVKTLLE